MNTRTRILSALALCLCVAAAPGVRASDDVDPVLKEKLSAQLTAQGYEVRKVQMEDGLIEAYAVKNGAKSELYFDLNLKPVSKAD